MDLLPALAHAFDHSTKLMGGVQADQLAEPTPCTDWDVQALVRHMTGVVTNIGRGVRGESLLADPNAIELDPDLQAHFRNEADRTLAAWTERGLDGEVNIGAGPMPAQAALGINLLDTSTHSWDLARATGQDAELPDDLAATALAVCQDIVTDEVRGFAGFEPEVPVGGDATPTSRLAAFLGRQP